MRRILCPLWIPTYWRTSYYADARKYLFVSRVYVFGGFFRMTGNMQHKTSFNSYTDIQDVSWKERKKERKSLTSSWGFSTKCKHSSTACSLSGSDVLNGDHICSSDLSRCDLRIYLKWRNFLRLHSSHC